PSEYILLLRNNQISAPLSSQIPDTYSSQGSLHRPVQRLISSPGTFWWPPVALMEGGGEFLCPPLLHSWPVVLSSLALSRSRVFGRAGQDLAIAVLLCVRVADRTLPTVVFYRWSVN
ncbi:hypothetical protein J6590_014069, partial [Homalodisca vitripennis]